MRYDIILADIDNTLLDFSADSYAGLEKTFREFGYPFGRPEWEIFSVINTGLWEAFERGEIPKAEIYPGRFRRYFAKQGIEGDPEAMNAVYMVHLREGRHRMPGSLELLQALKARGCRIYSVTNGETLSQITRLGGNGLRPYFDGLFISEEIGYQKPTKAFFDAVFAELGEDCKMRCILLGDSLTSDMQGGRNAGVDTCFFGSPEKADSRCDYVITRLTDFLPVVDGTAEKRR